MPLIIDLMENDLRGPILRQGREEGKEEGREEGKVAGEQRIIRLQLEKRFGPLPEWATAKLASLGVAEIELLAERIYDASSLDHLLR